MNDATVSDAVYKAVVGYLGTIEMPRGGGSQQGGGDLDALRHCIRRLRVEKKVHTSVLLCLGRSEISLLNDRCAKIAEYPSEQIAFCGTCADDKRFFGLVTNSKLNDSDSDHGQIHEESSSCHVFMTDLIQPSEEEAARTAKTYQFELTSSESGFEEFPLDSDPIISAVMALYGKSDDKNDREMNKVLPPSVESSPAKSSVAESICSTSSVSKLDIRAMPFPRTAGGSSGDDSFNTERLDEQSSADNIRQSMQRYLHSKQQHLKKVSEQLHQSNSAAIGPASKYYVSDYPPSSPSIQSFEDEAEARGYSLPPRTSLQNPNFSQHPSELPQPQVSLPDPSPLARYLCHSESNLSQLSAAGAALSLVSAAEAENVTAKERGHGRTTILRPGEQYPSEEPGVLKNTTQVIRGKIPKSFPPSLTS